MASGQRSTVHVRGRPGTPAREARRRCAKHAFRRFSVQAKPQAERVKIAKPFLGLFAATKRTEKNNPDFNE
jgi:hypothetical protein